MEMICIRWPIFFARAALLCLALGTAHRVAPAASPQRMVLIPAGEFTMGTNEPRTMPNERPARRVKVEGFWIDETSVTNAQFRKFVEATGHVTTAEKPVDWDELRKQVPPGT